MLFSAASLALLLFQFVLATHVETYSDANCTTSLTQWNGPNNGECTAVTRNGQYSSFKIVNLQPGCAITIYGPGTKAGPCDSNAAPGAIVANAGTCYNSTWAFYSIDGCFSAQTSQSTLSKSAVASSSSTAPSSTSSYISASTSATGTPQPTHHSSSTNVGAIVGGVVGGIAFGVIVAAIGIISFIRYRRFKRNNAHPPDYSGPPGSSHGLADMHAKELPGGALYHESRPGSTRSMPHTAGGPQELSTEGIAEVPSYPLAELDSSHHVPPKSPRDGLKS